MEMCKSCGKTSNEVEFDLTHSSDVSLCVGCSRELAKEGGKGYACVAEAIDRQTLVLAEIGRALIHAITPAIYDVSHALVHEESGSAESVIARMDTAKGIISPDVIKNLCGDRGEDE